MNARVSRLAAGSWPANSLMLAPDRVRSANGQMAMMPAGCWSPAIFRVSARASARPAPEDSPLSRIRDGATPLLTSPR